LLHCHALLRRPLIPLSSLFLGPRSHGYCKRSEVKSWLRHGRVTFEGELVRKLDQKVVVR